LTSASGRRWAWWWLLAWLCLYLATASGRISHGDDEMRFQMTQNLVESRTISIGHSLVDMPAMPVPGLLPQEGYAFETVFARPSERDDKFYSRYGPGQSLATLPLYLLGRLVTEGTLAPEQAYLTRLAVSMWNSLVGAACVLALTGFLLSLGFRRSTALLSAGAYGLTSMAWPYTKTFFSEPTVALCLIVGVWMLYLWHQNHRLRDLWSAGIATGVAILFRPTTALLHVPLLTVYLLWPQGQRSWRAGNLARALVAWGVPLALGALLVAAYNAYCWGSPLEFGYPDARWDVPFLLGLWGQLFSPGKSVFLYTPWLIAALVGLCLEWRHNRGLVSLVGFLWIAYLGFHASYQYWSGGWNWGPRFLLPVVPLATLGLARLWETRRVRGGRALVLVLLVAGFLIQAPAVLVSHSRHLVQLGETVGERFYTRSLYEPALSPALNQWRMVRDVWTLWQDPEARTATLEQVARHAQLLRAQAQNLQASGAEALWLTEFFRLNLFDFWWFHLWLLGAPLAVVLGVPGLLLGASLAGFLQSRRGLQDTGDLAANSQRGQ